MKISLLLLAAIGMAQQCRVPMDVKPARATRVDYRNANVATDYHALALSWSPQFCNLPAGKDSRNRWQCVENSFGFVVHGLWPQSARARSSNEHPRHCKAPELVPVETMKPYLCTIPGAQLMQDQWIKHGACAWPNAKGYFEQVEKLYRNLVLPDLKGGMTTAGAVRRTVAEANRAKGMRPEHVQVRVLSGNRFSEVLVCYDKQFGFAACAGRGTPDSVEVRVIAKR